MSVSASLRVLTCSTLLMVFCVGCSQKNRVEGRVIKSDFPGIQFIHEAGGNPDLIEGFGIGGARIEVVRDPRSLGRKVVASAMSGADGSFVLTVDAFGAGWMDEEWLFRCSHPNYPIVEMFGDMPTLGEGSVMEVRFGRPGPPGSGRQPIDEQERIRRELDRYGR